MMIMKDYKIIFIGMLIALGLVIYNGYIQKNSTSNLVETNGNRAKYEILVDVEESKLYLFEDGMCTKTFKCSGRKVVNTISHRNLDNCFKRYLGRRVWRQMDGA